MSENKEQLIEDYLLHRLQPQQRMEFEKRLSNDEALNKQLALHRLIIKGAKSTGKDRLKDRLKNIHQQVQAPPAKTRRLWPLLTSIAAAITLLILGGTFFFRGQALSPQELFVQNYQAYPLSLASRSQSEEAIKVQINQLYKNKEYQAALPLFEKLLGQDSQNARLQIGAGICHLELDQPGQARQYFSAIIEAQDFRLRDMAQWYMALSFLQEGKTDQARLHLTEILKNPNADKYQEAGELRNALEK